MSDWELAKKIEEEAWRETVADRYNQQHPVSDRLGWLAWAAIICAAVIALAQELAKAI